MRRAKREGLIRETDREREGIRRGRETHRDRERESKK